MLETKDCDACDDQTQKFCNANKSYPGETMWLFIDDKKKLKCYKYGTTNDFCALSFWSYGYRVSNIFSIQIIITI